MAKPTDTAPDNVDLVIPNEVAEHGGSGPAPVPHPLTPEANKEARPGEVANPDNAVIDKKVKQKTKKFSTK